MRWSLGRCDCMAASVESSCRWLSIAKVVVAHLVVQPRARLDSTWGRGHSHVIVGGGVFVAVSDRAGIGLAKSVQGPRDWAAKKCTSKESNCESRPLQKRSRHA